jgi:hypothetical protein
LREHFRWSLQAPALEALYARAIERAGGKRG